MTVGPLELLAPHDWLFHEFAGLIVARRDGGAGTLQITTAFQAELPGGSSGTAAEHLARQWTGDPVVAFVSLSGGSTPIGVGALENGSGWVWYSLAPGGLVLAMYRPTLPATDRKGCERDLEDVTSIVRSARWRSRVG
ncbi:MAG: hypothetical protein IPK26_30405 [Planctomycetes bacterium]|nr:hypothetical protein [Planctomycetota bacterium]